MKAKDRALIRELIHFGQDCIDVLAKLGNDRWTQIDARAWHRILSKRFASLTSGLDYSQTPNIKKEDSK